MLLGCVDEASRVLMRESRWCSAERSECQSLGHVELLVAEIDGLLDRGFDATVER